MAVWISKVYLRWYKAFNTDSTDRADTHKRPWEQVDGKELIVSLLRTSLNLWERSTNKSKVDLAEQSRWRGAVHSAKVGKTHSHPKQPMNGAYLAFSFNPLFVLSSEGQ